VWFWHSACAQHGLLFSRLELRPRLGAVLVDRALTLWATRHVSCTTALRPAQDSTFSGPLTVAHPTVVYVKGPQRLPQRARMRLETVLSTSLKHALPHSTDPGLRKTAGITATFVRLQALNRI